MKLPSRSELDDYIKCIAVAGGKGGAIGLGISGAGAFWARKRFPSYVKQGMFARTLVFMAPILFCGVTSMEYASREFEKRYYHPDIIKMQEKKEEDYANLPLSKRLKSFAIENKYKIVVGAWAGSLGGSFWLVNRDQYLTTAQKAVQARMYAQGLTVALLIASMALTSVSTGEQRRMEKEEQDETWKKIVAREEARLNSKAEVEEQAAGKPQSQVQKSQAQQ